MTAYTAIADSEIDPESPGTTTLFTKLRDNPIAITEGSSGAPDLVGATGASLVFIEKQTASASASLDFVTGIDSTYDTYIFKLNYTLPAADATDLRLLISTNGGSSFLTTSIYNLGGAAATTSLTLFTSASNDGTTGISGNLELFGPSNSIANKRCIFQLAGYNGTDFGGTNNVGNTNSATAVNAIRFIFSSGNIASGSISLYGVKIT